MNYGLLIFETLLGFVCAIFLIIWGIRRLNCGDLGLVIPSLIFGFLTLLMTVFAFHHISVEQGKDEIRKELKMTNSNEEKFELNDSIRKHPQVYDPGLCI